MIGDLSRATWSNYEQSQAHTDGKTIRPWLIRFEQELDRALTVAGARPAALRTRNRRLPESVGAGARSVLRLHARPRRIHGQRSQAFGEFEPGRGRRRATRPNEHRDAASSRSQGVSVMEKRELATADERGGSGRPTPKFLASLRELGEALRRSPTACETCSTGLASIIRTSPQLTVVCRSWRRSGARRHHSSAGKSRTTSPGGSDERRIPRHRRIPSRPLGRRPTSQRLVAGLSRRPAGGLSRHRSACRKPVVRRRHTSAAVRVVSRRCARILTPPSPRY